MTHPPPVISSRVSWLITIVLSLAGALAHATTCDVDADGDIDRKDYLAILADIGERASGPNDPRDADRNGRILSNDAQLCARRCTPWTTAIEDGDPGVTQALTFNVTGNTNASLFSAGPSVSPTGALTYTPAADANGTATITLTLADDGGAANGGDDTSDPQSFTITVNAVNDAPAFSAGSNQAVDEDSGAQSVSGPRGSPRDQWMNPARRSLSR